MFGGGSIGGGKGIRIRGGGTLRLVGIEFAQGLGRSWGFELGMVWELVSHGGICMRWEQSVCD